MHTTITPSALRRLRSIMFAFAFAAAWPWTAAQAIELAQVGHDTGANVCGDVATGLGDLDNARYLTWSDFVGTSGTVRKRIEVQLNSGIRIRLLGHRINLGTVVNGRGRDVDLTGSGAYVNQPGGTEPIGYIELRVRTSAFEPPGNVDVIVDSAAGRNTVPLRFVPTCVQTAFPRMFCFGALGQNCGGPILPHLLSWGLLPEISSCDGTTCLVNAGSWKHDECCTVHHDGFFCDGVGWDEVQGKDKVCKAEFDTGRDRILLPLLEGRLGYSWVRAVSPTVPDDDGKVDPARFCAPSGTIIHPMDKKFCCSSFTGLPPIVPGTRERVRSEQAMQLRLVRGYRTPGPAQGVVADGSIACD